MRIPKDVSNCQKARGYGGYLIGFIVIGECRAEMRDSLECGDLSPVLGGRHSPLSWRAFNVEKLRQGAALQGEARNVGQVTAFGWEASPLSWRAFNVEKLRQVAA